MPIFIEIEALLSFVTKASLTNGTRLKVFLEVFFGWFQLSFKKQCVVPGDFGSFWGVPCFSMYPNNFLASLAMEQRNQ